MWLTNSSPAIDDNAHDNKVIEEDQVTHNTNDTQVPQANDDYEHLKAHDHQEAHASSDSTDSEALSSAQVLPVHSPSLILKNVVTDDIKKN